MNIKDVRKQLNWTQAKMAKYLGVSEMTIRRWEANQHRPSKLALRQIARLEKKLNKIEKVDNG